MKRLSSQFSVGLPIFSKQTIYTTKDDALTEAEIKALKHQAEKQVVPIGRLVVKAVKEYLREHGEN